MVATMMAGVLLILLGIFKLGTVIKFIPYPIIIGFTSGIAVTILPLRLPIFSDLILKVKKYRAILSENGFFIFITSIR